MPSTSRVTSSASFSRAARAARASLAGIVSSSAESSAAAAVALGIDSTYASAADLIDDESIDVVHIVTPNATHFELALAALGRGKHVVCEKPLTTSSADATRLVRAAAEAGVTATVPFVYRFHPMVREARARVAAGETGTLVSIQGSYLQDWLLEASDDNWRVAEALGGPSRAFADIGSHLCDMVEFVTGDRIARLQAITRTVFDERSARTVTTEDLAAVLVEMRSGALGTLLVSQLAPGRKNRLHFELNGTEESIEFDQENPESHWLGRRKGSQLIPRDADQLHPDAARLSIVPAGQSQGYQDAFNAFVADSYAAVRGEAPDGLPRFSDGLRAVRITEAVMVAAVEARWVEVAKE